MQIGIQMKTKVEEYEIYWKEILQRFEIGVYSDVIFCNWFNLIKDDLKTAPYVNNQSAAQYFIERLIELVKLQSEYNNKLQNTCTKLLQN